MVDYRWDKPWSSSISYLQFRKHHQQINDMYWSFFYGSAALNKNIDDVEAEGVTTEKYFNFITSSIAIQNYSSIENWDTWKAACRNFEKITRINFLLDANSYFEIYLRNIFCVAMESRPDLNCVSSCKDGFQLLKTDNKYHSLSAKAQSKKSKYQFAPQLLSLTKGWWPSRLKEFSSIFGGIPPVLKTHESDLEHIRVIRNSVGHFFGRDKSTSSIISPKPDEIIVLSDDDLKKYLSVLFDCAKAIDDFLFSKYVGSYECVLFCLQVAEEEKIDVIEKHIAVIVKQAATKLKENGYTVGNKHLEEALRLYLSA